MPNLSKYFHVQQNSFGEPLAWPGTLDGYPFAGTPPRHLKQEEYEDVPLRLNYCWDEFILPRDRERYIEIKDRAANGWYLLRKEDGPHYDPESKTYRATLEWVEVYGVTPPPKHPAARDAHAPVPDRPESYVQDRYRAADRRMGSH